MRDAICPSRLELAAACMLALWACKPTVSLPPVQFTPHKAEYAREATSPQPIIERALVIYDGDLATLAVTQPLLLGWMRTRSEEAAARKAARYGGTHVLLVQSAAEQRRSEQSCTAWALGQGVSTLECVDVYREVPDMHYAVLRVEREQWSALPSALAPKTSCNVVALPKVGCRYVRDEAIAFQKRDTWWEVCGEDREDVTARFPENPCVW